jgi:hypothetical protein
MGGCVTGVKARFAYGHMKFGGFNDAIWRVAQITGDARYWGSRAIRNRNDKIEIEPRYFCVPFNSNLSVEYG